MDTKRSYSYLRRSNVKINLKKMVFTEFNHARFIRICKWVIDVASDTERKWSGLSVRTTQICKDL